MKNDFYRVDPRSIERPIQGKLISEFRTKHENGEDFIIFVFADGVELIFQYEYIYSWELIQKDPDPERPNYLHELAELARIDPIIRAYVMPVFKGKVSLERAMIDIIKHQNQTLAETKKRLEDELAHRPPRLPYI